MSSTSTENSLAIFEIGYQNQDALSSHLNSRLVLVQKAVNCCASPQFWTPGAAQCAGMTASLEAGSGIDIEGALPSGYMGQKLVSDAL